MLKSEKELEVRKFHDESSHLSLLYQVSRATARTVSIYASPLRVRKIRSTLNFSNIVGVGLSRSTYPSLLSLHSAQDSSIRRTQLSLSSVKSSEDDYVKGIRKILETSIREPRTREATLAKCSGLATGELSCKLCFREYSDNSITASQEGYQRRKNIFSASGIKRNIFGQKTFFPLLWFSYSGNMM